MIEDAEDKSPQPATRQSELLPAILAIALAVASQLAVQDGLTLLGLAGYVAAAWLFVSSVRPVLDLATRRPAPVGTTPGQDELAPAEGEYQVDATIDGAGRLGYLRRNWRQVTLAEIFAGDIPPARLMALEASSEKMLDERGAAAPTGEPAPETAEEALPAGPLVAAARISTWSASKSPASSPRAVKVTPQGDVLVLDTGLEQVQRFDEHGNLLVTYRLSGFAGVQVADLDVSPDGQTLYVVDVASGHLQVITLSRVKPEAGQVGGESEEE